MNLYRVTATVEVEVSTLVNAENETEALEKVQEREVDICIHGSEMMDGLHGMEEQDDDDREFVLANTPETFPEPIEAEEYD